MICEGVILKALRDCYYVESAEVVYECRARGRFRLEKVRPLVGDHVVINTIGGLKGYITEILPRKNEFKRPMIANLELLVIIAANTIPVTDPFLIDRLVVIAEQKSCEPLICINKTDLGQAEELFQIYTLCGFQTIRTSAITGEGISELRNALCGKICAFTGNSGVGKSSILNAIEPKLNIQTADVSIKLGRGRHTTRHVELFKIANGAIIADTPGFSAFDVGSGIEIPETELQYAFREFEPYIYNCRFRDCAHIKETNCAVLQALHEGLIPKSRHMSYVRLYEELKAVRLAKYV